MISKETITLYWRDRDNHFTEENSYRLHYMPDHLIGSNLYTFTFKLPDLNKINSIRLDPFISNGLIRIVSMKMSEGLFNRQHTIALDEVVAGVQELFNLKIKEVSSGLLIETFADDPHVVLFKDVSKGILEQFLIFAIVLSVVSLGCSAFIQRGKGNTNTATIFAGAAVIVIVLFVALRMQYSSYAKWRFLDSEQVTQLLEETPRTDISVFETPNDQEVILLGDSHAGNYAYAIERWSRKRDKSFGVQGIGACPPVFWDYDFNKTVQLSPAYRACAERHNNEIAKIIENETTEYVFLAIRHGFYLAHPRNCFEDAFIGDLNNEETAQILFKSLIVHTIQSLQNAGKKVVVLGQVPLLQEHPKTCLSRNVSLFSILSVRNKSSCDMDKNLSNARLKPGDELFKMIVSDNPEILYFDPDKYIDTIFSDDGSILYSDTNHLSHKGAIYIYPFIEKDLP